MTWWVKSFLFKIVSHSHCHSTADEESVGQTGWQTLSTFNCGTADTLLLFSPVTLLCTSFLCESEGSVYLSDWEHYGIDTPLIGASDFHFTRMRFYYLRWRTRAAAKLFPLFLWTSTSSATYIGLRFLVEGDRICDLWGRFEQVY